MEKPLIYIAVLIGVFLIAFLVLIFAKQRRNERYFRHPAERKKFTSVSNVAIGLPLGIAIGLALGYAMNNMPAGIGIGTAIGISMRKSMRTSIQKRGAGDATMANECSGRSSIAVLAILFALIGLAILIFVISKIR